MCVCARALYFWFYNNDYCKRTKTPPPHPPPRRRIVRVDYYRHVCATNNRVVAFFSSRIISRPRRRRISRPKTRGVRSFRQTVFVADRCSNCGGSVAGRKSTTTVFQCPSVTPTRTISPRVHARLLDRYCNSNTAFELLFRTALELRSNFRGIVFYRNKMFKKKKKTPTFLRKTDL